jgi:hypothetical protein
MEVRRDIPTATAAGTQFPRVQSFENATDCSICLDPMVPDQKTKLSCKHVYHKLCISDWLETHNTCPTCVRNINVLEKNRVRMDAQPARYQRSISNFFHSFFSCGVRHGTRF